MLSFLRLESLFLMSILAVSPAHADLRYDAVSNLINNHEYQKADKLVDDDLKKDKRWVDGWMFKGNLVIYQGCTDNGMYVGANPDDSIYDEAIGIVGDSSDPDSCSVDVAKRAVHYFQKALDLDPSRSDIQLGACWILSKAGLVDELIPRMGIIKNKFDNDKRAFDLMDYVRYVTLSSNYENGKKLFLTIESLYPEEGDLPGEFYATALKCQNYAEAHDFALQAIRSRNHDGETSSNVILIATLLGDDSLALYAAKDYSKKSGNNYWMLYSALLRRLRDDSNWSSDLGKYLQSETSESDDKSFALKYQANKSDTPEAYDALAKSLKDSPLYILLAQWEIKNFPEQIDDELELADTYGGFKVYDPNTRILREIISDNGATSVQKDKCRLRMAWAYRETGQKDLELRQWKTLVNSNDFYSKSAACWYLGANLEERKDLKGALTYYKMVSGDPSDSKYANYCYNEINKIGLRN